MNRGNVDLADSIRTWQVQVPLSEALCLGLHQPADEALSALTGLNYDQAPVLVLGRPRYWVSRKALASPGVRVVGDVKQLIEPEILISADATIRELIGGFDGQSFLLVLDGRSIAGIVTPSDLNKQPARTYFFLRIAEFESRVAAIVRDQIGDDTAYELLRPERQAQLEEAKARAKGDNLELGWISYFYLDDLIDVVRQAATVRRLLGDPDEGHWNSRTEGLAGVRNAAVHLVRNLVDSGRTPKALGRIDRNLSDLLERTRRAAGLRSG